MKKLIASLSLFGLLLIPAQGAFAWTYDGLGSLNPFTGFRNCNKCEKQDKCYRPKTANYYNDYRRVQIIPNCNRCSKTFNMEENCPCNKRAHY